MQIIEVKDLFKKKGWEIYTIVKLKNNAFRVYFSDSFLWYCIFYPEDKDYIPNFYNFYNSEKYETQKFKGCEVKKFGKKSMVFWIETPCI